MTLKNFTENIFINRYTVPLVHKALILLHSMPLKKLQECSCKKSHRPKIFARSDKNLFSTYFVVKAKSAHKTAHKIE